MIQASTINVESLEILGWAHLGTGSPPDWISGAMLLGSAALAALIGIFVQSPTNLPALAGADRVMGIDDDLKTLEKQQQGMLLGQHPPDGQIQERAHHLTYLSGRL